MGIQRRHFLHLAGAFSAITVAQGISIDRIRSTARGITVLIRTPGGSGTGILVGRDGGGLYTVLTANHVVEAVYAGEEAYIHTSDGETHRLKVETIKKFRQIDLATFQFQSTRSYLPAILGDSDKLQTLDLVYVAGFPILDRSQPFSFTMTDGKISSRTRTTDGYELIYTATTKEGMSGGPVLNAASQLIGIHGQADGKLTDDGPLKSGFNLAIPINTYKRLMKLPPAQRYEQGQPSPPSTPTNSTNPSTSSTSSTPSKPIEAIPPGPLPPSAFIVAVVSPSGAIVDRRQGTARSFSEMLDGGVVLDLLEIPAGRFLMGAAELEGSRKRSESPQHSVTVSAFFMGRYQITQAQWQAVMGTNPSRFKGGDRPVEQISWLDGKEFCRRLSQKTGRSYRLPTEAEWEYACRGGTPTPFHFGETLTTTVANYDGFSVYGAGPTGDYRMKTTPVGSFGVANAWGLYDMHGNVWEWCEDVWHDNYGGAPGDGSAWVTGGQGDRRVLRGGGWSSVAQRCRSAERGRESVDYRHSSFGLRVVTTTPGPNLA